MTCAGTIIICLVCVYVRVCSCYKHARSLHVGLQCIGIHHAFFKYVGGIQQPEFTYPIDMILCFVRVINMRVLNVFWCNVLG